MRTCLDLFAGLGGFSLAAQANGIRALAMVEKEAFLRAGLERAWPDVKIYDDITTFDATAYRGVWLVAGGPPCQPASRAGEQRGAADDRWLWDESIRVVEESRPTWTLFENPPGILDVGLDGILADLAGLGYEVQPVSIPACAVNSPQDRERIWIVGHRTEPGLQGHHPDTHQATERAGREQPRRCVAESVESIALGSDTIRGQPVLRSASGNPGLDLQPVEGGTMANRIGAQLREAPASGPDREKGTLAQGPTQSGAVADGQKRSIGTGLCTTEPTALGRGRFGDSHWQNFEWLPCPDGKGGTVIRRVPNNFHSLVDEFSSAIPKAFRSKIIAALGNAIVWPVAAEIISAMLTAETQCVTIDK